MNAKTSAHYQREFRRRLRAQGLVKKEVWILPEHAKTLSNFEKQHRLPAGQAITTGASYMTSVVAPWTTQSLFKALQTTAPFNTDSASIELIDGSAASLHITMHDYGDLPIFITVSGDQIVIESVLWPLSSVKDANSFNEAVLMTHKYFPLSTISLDRHPEGECQYQMFGAMSAASLLSNVLLEIDVLAQNVIQATEAYAEFIA